MANESFDQHASQPGGPQFETALDLYNNRAINIEQTEDTQGTCYTIHGLRFFLLSVTHSAHKHIIEALGVSTRNHFHVVYPRKMLPMFVFQAFSCQIWAKYLMGDAAMVANLDITRFCQLLVLVTNWALKKDLEVSVPSNLIFFSAHVFLDMSQETFINNII